MNPWGKGIRPWTRAKYRFSTFFHSLPAANWFLAATTAPVVSLSRRFKARKGVTAPARAQWAA